MPLALPVALALALVVQALEALARRAGHGNAARTGSISDEQGAGALLGKALPFRITLLLSIPEASYRASGRGLFISRRALLPLSGNSLR